MRASHLISSLSGDFFQPQANRIGSTRREHNKLAVKNIKKHRLVKVSFTILKNENLDITTLPINQDE